VAESGRDGALEYYSIRSSRPAKINIMRMLLQISIPHDPFNAAVKDGTAGLEHLEIHPHMLRHSCGYALVNKGTDIRIIQGYLGHRSISSTVRYTTLDRKRFAKLF
jgi:integrase